MKINQLTSFLNQAKLTLDDIRRQGGRAVSQVDRLEKSLEIFKNGLMALQKDNATLTIGIVGQMNVGKSSFLNALMFEGKEILPIAATPMTAGLTILEYADSIESQRFEVEYYTENDWADIEARSKIVEDIKADLVKEKPELISRSKAFFLEQQIKEKCGDKENYACYLLKSFATGEAHLKINGTNDVIPLRSSDKMSDVLANYVGAKGKFTSAVKALHIYLHSNALTYKNENTGIVESYRIVDTPGVNDPIVSRQRQTERFLQEAHAVFMLTRADTFLTGADVDFVNAKINKEGISQVLLVANKLDLLFATDGNCPADLEDAINYEIQDLERQLMDRGRNIERRPIALYCTAGIAECIRLKMSKNFNSPELNSDEEQSLKLLRNKFPNDFSDKSTLDSLDMIADFSTIIEEYIQGTFLKNKDSIIDRKISCFVECHRDAIMNDFKSVIDEVEKELALAKDCDVNTIVSQIAALNKLQQVAIPTMQTNIGVFSRKLQEFHVPKLFETKEELLQYKPALIDNCYDYKSISYTRESTFLGRTKSGFVYVNVLNPSSVSKSEDKKIDELRNQINKRWTSIYNAEENSLKGDLLDAIKEIASQDPSLNINVDIYEMIIMSCIKDKLCGKSQLRLEDKCSEQKKQIVEYVNLSEHTSFSCSFGEMSEDDADEKIKKQAEDKLKAFQSGMQSRNDSIYKELRKEVEKHCDSINTIMINFANNLTNKIQEQLDEIKGEKENSLNNVEYICRNIEKRKNKFIELQNIFSQL